MLTFPTLIWSPISLITLWSHFAHGLRNKFWEWIFLHRPLFPLSLHVLLLHYDFGKLLMFMKGWFIFTLFIFQSQLSEAGLVGWGSIHDQHSIFFKTSICYIAHLAPLSMEFSMQEYWSGQWFPSPGNLQLLLIVNI